MIQTAYAETVILDNMEQLPSVELDQITVVGSVNKEATDATVDVKTAKFIKDHQIDDNLDLVRYQSDITVADAGRYGSNGYAIRGVDGNRVALNFDGVALPDKQVNEIFSAYGYMYEGRFSPDVELLSEARLKVGTDSFESGSGAMGGAVNFKTKDPNDLIKPGKNIGGYIKLGYADRNEEFNQSIGLAGRNKNLEFLVNYVHRDGHELKNHRMIAFDKKKLDPGYDFENDPDYRYPSEGYKNNSAAILPDPLDFSSDAALAKVYMHVNDEHRVGLQGVYQVRKGDTNNFARKTFGTRLGKDKAELTSYGINYRHLPLDSSVVDEIKGNLTYQKVIGVANTETYSAPYGTTDYKIDGIKHRPQTDETIQLHLEGKSLPIDTQKFGTHHLGFDTSYAQKDHELIMEETYIPSSGDSSTWYDFLGPSVKQDVFSFALSDKIEVSDRLTAKVGLRYDDYKYKPYVEGKTKEAIKRANENYSVRIQYENGELEKKRNMDNLGGLLALNYKLTPKLEAGYSVATGFRVPATSQMYSAFEMMGNNLKPNLDLSPEKSLNHELTLSGDFDTFNFSATGFYTDYKDFIDLVNYQEEQQRCYNDWSGEKICDPFIVNVIGAKNIGKAKTYGVSLGGMWDISDKANTAGRLRLFGNMAYAKDKTDKGINLLATQPLNGVLGLSYQSDDQGYMLNANLRYLGAKKAKDAKVVSFYSNGWNQKATEVIEPYKHIGKSESAYVYDLYGSKKFNNGLKLSAGIYNLFDKKYVPWDNLRSLAELNVNSMVDSEGVGIERYTAPGRNYKVGLTYEF